MKLLIFGSQTIGGACLEALLETPPAVQIVGVVAAPDDPPRLMSGTPRSLEASARTRQLPLFPPEKTDGPEFAATVRSLAPDLMLLLDYPRHLEPAVLALPPRGAINLYATLLPAYRGHAPHIRAVQHGEHTTGVTLHTIAPGPEALLAQQTVPIVWTDTSDDVYRKQTAAAAQLLLRTWPQLLAGAWPSTPLPASSMTPFGPMSADERAIDWNQSGVSLYNLIRAVTHPYPGAYAGFRGARCTIWRADVRPAPLTGALPPPGTITKFVPFQVVTGDGVLLLRQLQLEGEPELDSAAFIAHYQAVVGERFTLWTP